MITVFPAVILVVISDLQVSCTDIIIIIITTTIIIIIQALYVFLGLTYLFFNARILRQSQSCSATSEDSDACSVLSSHPTQNTLTHTFISLTPPDNPKYTRNARCSVAS
jgi:hypothetical protein